jgi:hypothetical protein
MHAVIDERSRAEALRSRQKQDAELEARIERAMANHRVDEDECPDAPVGCFPRLVGCVIPWRGRGAASMQRLAHEEAASASGAAGSARTHSRMETAIFGQAKGAAGQSASERLQSAAANVEVHVQQLGEKASLARARAAQLMSEGNRAGALMALKKAKAAEKQLETAAATHAALESQVDVLAQSELQKQVASALSASVATTKKKTKGLLSKAETAVDEAIELKDFAEDVTAALGGLQAEQFDEDELMAELEELAAPAVATKKVVFKEEEAEAKPAGVGVGVGAGAERFPSAPSRPVTAALLEEEAQETAASGTVA